MKETTMHVTRTMACICLAALIGLADAAHAGPARGPLRVHPENPRYFTDGTQGPDGSPGAVYLTGAHTWNNLVDMDRSDPPEQFDFAGYLDFLERHHHNFIRLWAWDSTRWDTRANGALGKDFIHKAAPQPWLRTGPGEALDGKPKFDLTKFEPAYFERLRSRVAAAGERGIYVSVMLFEGWGLMHGNRRQNTEDGWAWRSHPFHPANNINGLEIEGSDDLSGRVHTLRNPKVNELQAVYIRKVVDTIHEYERTKPKQHPVGNTGHGAERLPSMLASPAEWVSPGRADGFAEDPPVWNEEKVSLLDTDHVWGVGGNPAWVWRSFLRGHNPIFMDPYDGSVLGRGRDWEPLRTALGHARRLAERVNLAAIVPHNDLASTGYCLADPGREYVVYQPKKNETFSLELAAGIYWLEWFDPAQGARTDSARIEASGGGRQFKGPFAADAVLYLKKVGPLSKEVELYHWVDFPIEAPGATDGVARWDVEGACVWTHENGTTQRTSLVWYSGSGDTYVYRFGGSLPGRWTGITSSPVTALDSLELTVEVMPSRNPDRAGWSGQRPEEPTAWAHQKGPNGELVKNTPILIMMPGMQHWFDKPAEMRDFVAEFNDHHGFNGGHISTIGRNWFEADSTDRLRTAPAAPDVRTFEALEAAASEWSERGGWLHLWMWGKGDGGDFSNLPGGHNGAQSRRINRYIAARLGPVPGWSMGIGWDVEFWADEAKLTWWLDDLIPQLGGWHHWIGFRYSDSDIGQGRDPDPANKGQYLERGVAWNTLRPGDEQYAGWEHWATTTSDSAIDAGLAAIPDRPMMSEDRFRRRDNAWRQKDMHSDDAILKEIPRWATRGVAAIYGRLIDSKDGGSDVWPNKAAIKAVISTANGKVADRADDEQGGVLFGVYTGNDKKEFFSFEGAFGRRIEAVLAYTGDRNWQDANPGWQLSPRWLAGTGRELLWSIPMIPNDEVVQTSREAANGAHNETYQSWARQILESRSDDDRPIYVRTTWEVGGEWFYWTEAAKEDPEAFKAAWRQWAQSFHAVSPRFKMVWDFTADRGPVEQWYPGDEAVDVISQDIYWNPQWQGDDPVEAFETSVSGYSRGLAWMAEFATQHDKPMAISEWSPGDRPGAEVWIEQFSQWVHSHNVVYTTYWAGGEGSGYDGTLSEGPVLEALREFAAKCGSRPLP